MNMQLDQLVISVDDRAGTAREMGEYYYEKIIRARDVEQVEGDPLNKGRWIAICCADERAGEYVTAATEAQAMRKFVDKFGDVLGWTRVISK